MFCFHPINLELITKLNFLAKEKLLSPLMVIDALSTSLTCTLGDVRDYLNSVLRQELEQVKSDTELTEKYRKDTEKLREQIQTIKNSTIIFQGSRCSACHHQLELPSVHFMCQHSYHQQLVFCRNILQKNNLCCY